MSIDPKKKRLAKIFGTYALTVSLLFGTGYGLQTVVNNLDKRPEATQTIDQHKSSAETTTQRTPAKYFWMTAPAKQP